MRLQDTLHLLEECAPALQWSPTAVSPGASPHSQNLRRLNQLAAVRQAVQLLKQASVLSSEIQRVESSPMYQASDGLITDLQAATDLYNRIVSLRGAVDQLRSLLRQAIPKAEPDSLHLKLPPLQTLSELTQFVKGMDLIFDIPVRRLLDHGVNFSGFDTGSDWLIISPEVISTAAVVAKAASIVSAGTFALSRVSRFLFDFLAKYQIWRTDCLNYRNMVAQAESYQGAVQLASQLRGMQAEIAEQQKHLVIKQLIDAHAEGIPTEKVAEARNAALIAMSELDKWVQLGTEVHTALSAPAEIQRILPQPVSVLAPMPKALAEHQPAEHQPAETSTERPPKLTQEDAMEVTSSEPHSDKPPA